VAVKRLSVRLNEKELKHVRRIGAALDCGLATAIRHIIREHMLYYEYRMDPPLWALILERNLRMLPPEDAEEFMRRVLEVSMELVKEKAMKVRGGGKDSA